ncbi:MAG: sigma-70 family RNA polymerase sigma factor [Planctomycetota bacterium]
MTTATAEPSALSTLNDGELLKRFLTTRDEIAFQELTTRHSGMVYSVAGRMLGSVSAADDIVQAAFLLLIDKAPSLTNRVSVAGWLHQATQYIVNNHRRAEKRRATAQTASASGRRTMKTATETDPLDQAQTQEALSTLDDALGELREPFRLALVLHYFEGLSVTQIAERLNVEAGTVKSRLGRGLEKLRSALSRRKSVVGAAALAFLLTSQQAQAAPPLALASLTAAVSGGAAPLSNIIALAQGGKSMFFIAKMKMIAAVAASVLVVSGAAVSGAVLSSQPDRHQPKQTPVSVRQETPAQPVSGPVLSATAVSISVSQKPSLDDPSAALTAKLNQKVGYDVMNLTAREILDLLSETGKIPVSFAKEQEDALRQLKPIPADWNRMLTLYLAPGTYRAAFERLAVLSKTKIVEENGQMVVKTLRTGWEMPYFGSNLPDDVRTKLMTNLTMRFINQKFIGAHQLTEHRSVPLTPTSVSASAIIDESELTPIAPIEPMVCGEGDLIRHTDLTKLKSLSEKNDDLAGVWYDIEKKRVYFKGIFCLERGTLEFVIVGDAGKNHETVVQVNSAPLDIAYALLVCGFPYSASYRIIPGGDGSTRRLFNGQAIDIFFEYEENGVNKRKPARTFIKNAKTNDLIADVPFIFTGSKYVTEPQTGNKQFLANIERNIAAVFFDPASILNTPLNTGYDDTYYIIKEDVIPKAQTPVLVILQPASRNADPEKRNRFKDEELRDDGGSSINVESSSPFLDADAPRIAPKPKDDVRSQTNDLELDALMKKLDEPNDLSIRISPDLKLPEPGFARYEVLVETNRANNASSTAPRPKPKYTENKIDLSSNQNEGLDFYILTASFEHVFEHVINAGILLDIAAQTGLGYKYQNETIDLITWEDMMRPVSDANQANLAVVSNIPNATNDLLQQKVTFNFVDVPLKDALQFIENLLVSDTGRIHIQFDPALVRRGLDTQPVSLAVNEMPAKDAIGWLLKNNQLLMSIKGDVILIYKLEQPPHADFPAEHPNAKLPAPVPTPVPASEPNDQDF